MCSWILEFSPCCSWTAQDDFNLLRRGRGWVLYFLCCNIDRPLTSIDKLLLWTPDLSVLPSLLLRE
jgi:hypothetical protein